MNGPFRAPRRAPAGAKVQIVAPCSPYDEATLALGRARIERAGLVVTAVQARSDGAAPFINGDDSHRARVLVDALRSDADVVWVARGGYGMTRLLPQVAAALEDVWNTARPFPVVVGFSDVTALFGLLFRHGIRALHGPLATSAAHESGEAFLALIQMLADDSSAPRTLDGAMTWHPGPAAHGPLFVGNLCVLTHLVGTPFMPDLRGAILGLEEIGERPYRVDRMLTHLITSGALDGVAGVLTGDLSGCDDDNITAPAVFAERLDALGVPYASGFPFGHRGSNMPLPVGARATLHTTGATPRLFLDEGLYA